MTGKLTPNYFLSVVGAGIAVLAILTLLIAAALKLG
jgi:hypothetical protein